MKGKVKLFPSNDGVICKDCYIEYNNKLHIVDFINDESITIINLETNKVNLEANDINITNIKYLHLMKFYVVNRKKIIGELDFSQYYLFDPLLNNNHQFNFTTTSILNNIKVGDKVRIFRLKSEYVQKYGFNKLDGAIANINNRKVTVHTIFGDDLEVRRKDFKLIEKPNYKNICTLII